MVSYSHILWSALWLGIAADAVARAARFVRAEARKKPGAVPPKATRAREGVADAAERCGSNWQSAAQPSSMRSARPTGMEELLDASAGRSR